MPIALLTDFGTADYYVGAMKGVILAVNRKAVIVDITHEIAPQDIQSAAFILRACYKDFPPATVFCCVVDPGVGSERRAIIVESNQQFFVGPDNGLFGFLFDGSVKITAIEKDRYFRKPVSTTFHGRDIFSPVSAHISLGVPSHEFGPAVDDAVQIIEPRPTRISVSTIEGSVIHIDRFGNIVTNITADESGRDFELELAGLIVSEIRKSYAGAPTGKLFAIVGSAGFIEISTNGGSAAVQTDVKLGTPVILTCK